MQKKLLYVPPKHQLDVHAAFPLPQRASLAVSETGFDVISGSIESATFEALYEEFTSITSVDMPREMKQISERLARTVLVVEEFARRELDDAFEASETEMTRERIAKLACTAWREADRLFEFALEKRGELDVQHRLTLWISRLRCISLASVTCFKVYTKLGTSLPDATAARSTSLMRQARIDAFSTRCNVNRDQEMFVAHGILWPYDDATFSLFRWCKANQLLVSSMKNCDGDIYNACTNTLWRLIQNLLSRWIQLPYGCHLVAYTWRLLERVALICTTSGDRSEFNHPVYIEKIPDSHGEFCVNLKFFEETEKTFFAVESRMRKCMYIQWPRPIFRADASEALLSQPISEEAIDRFEAFITKNLDNPRFKQYIEKDFEVVFFDHVLHPGEMERFEKLRPHDDRKPLSCISRMRRNDFDRYQRLFTQPPIQETWKYILENKESLRTHPAYMLVASRVLQYHFDSTFDGASFDCYFTSLDKIPIPHLRASIESALRDHMGRTMTRGSARHFLCGTLLRTGLRCTPDSMYPHPLIVQCIGQYTVVSGGKTLSLTPCTNFATAFLLWLREFCDDSQLHGTFANGSSVLPLLRELNVFPDGYEIADRAERVRATLELERSEMAQLEHTVNALEKQVPSRNTSSVVVFPKSLT